MKEQEKGFCVDLKEEINGFDPNIKIQIVSNNGTEIRNMNVRDVLQHAISSLNSNPNLNTKLEFNDLKWVFKLVPRISNDKDKLFLDDPEEKKFLIEAVKNTLEVKPIPKAFALSKLNAF